MAMDLAELMRQYAEAQEQGLIPGGPRRKGESERLFALRSQLLDVATGLNQEQPKSYVAAAALGRLVVQLKVVAAELGAYALDLEQEGR